MAAPTYYSYTPLDTTSECTRLIKIDNRSHAEPVKCQVYTFPLSQCPPYIALSYTWGDPKGRGKLIDLDGKRFTVRENLGSFLRTINYEGDELFWIDAICIDQSSHAERNHQVGLMRSIYTQAVRVMVWLGEGDTKSDLSVDYITKGISSGLDPSSSALHTALEHLFTRPYWTRVWIVQEVMLARDVVFLCGRQSFTWDQVNMIRRGAKTGQSTNGGELATKHGIDSSGSLLLTIRNTPGWLILGQRSIFDAFPQDRRQFPLLALLDTYGAQQSADVKDRVYGLLGLATEHSLRVDYSISEEDLYIDVLEAILAGSESPDINELNHIEDTLHRVLRLSRDLRSRSLLDGLVQGIHKHILIRRLRQKVLDRPPPMSLEDTAEAYYAQNRLDKVLELYVDRLGECHYATLEIMWSIASAYQRQGRWKDVEDIWVKLLRIRKEEISTGNISALRQLDHIKSAYHESGREEELLFILGEALGGEHPESERALLDYAQVLSRRESRF
ncbi:TPR-like protein [Echria macrotheca]|uniref:TPR-like protein n=1 Tax=Echria macrotheca TaxID=438768 RepID=A0AAJ0F1H0_9PEZI|nr:TPR-like protein [Echria macrotheca]